jgi:hypothetical protein
MCQLCIDAGWKQIKKPVEYQCDGMMYLWLFICANSLAKHKNKRSYRHFPMAALSRSPECDPVFTFQFNQQPMNLRPLKCRQNLLEFGNGSFLVDFQVLDDQFLVGLVVQSTFARVSALFPREVVEFFREDVAGASAPAQ